MAVVNFNGFSIAIHCILVICREKLSMSRMAFKFSTADFAMAALLRRIEGA